MATCFHCKTKETALYETDVPICLSCAGLRSIRRKPANADQESIRAKLHEDLMRATDRNELATAHNRLHDFLCRGSVPEDLNRHT